ncbi:hypothetical protein FRC12_020681 [Ceratobasidium sp. 428]|nr:hypothetical protein FRC12_020681 [Ceratobasidium sp. 428]
MSVIEYFDDHMDTSSKEYKRALRHHLKSEHHKADVRSEPVSAFRAAEKKYKARFPPPDLSDVLDLATLDPERTAEIDAGGWKGAHDAAAVRQIQLRRNSSGEARTAYLIQRIPGLVLVPSFVGPAEQRSLVTRCLREHARSPNESNLDAHYHVPSAGLWNEWETVSKRREVDPEFDIVVEIKWKKDIASDEYHPPDTERTLVDNTPGSLKTFVSIKSQPKLAPMPSSSLSPTTVSTLIPKLRWSNIGLNYHWGTKSYDFEREKVPFPDDIRDICVDAVRSIQWKDVWEGEAEGMNWDDGEDWNVWEHTYEPDAGIINFYQPKDTLMGHVDRSEISSTTPLVSISLGNAAIFLIGGTTRDVEPVPILLRSGDIVIMSGPGCRRAYHGVPRILEGTTPSHLLSSDPLVAEYIKNARINCNVRQVFPTQQ